MDTFKAPLAPKPKLAPIAPVSNPLAGENAATWTVQGHGLMLPPTAKAKPMTAPDATASATPSIDAAPVAPAADPATPKVDLKYQIPIWSPKKAVHPWKVEVLKSGQVVGEQEINSKGHFLVGRLPICDVELEHPTISRQHAILQHRSNGNLYVYDLASTHGTFVNKNRIKPNVYVQLKNNYQVRFGESTRSFLVQGGPEEEAVEEKPAEPTPEQRLNALGRPEDEDAEKKDEAAKQEEEGKDLFTGNLAEFKQFMKKQRGKATNKHKKPQRDQKKLLEQLPELSRKVQGLGDDSDSEEDEGAAAPEAPEELPEDLELATRVTAAEELYDSGNEGDEFYDRTRDPKSKKESDSESDESEDDDDNPEAAAARRKKRLRKQQKAKAKAAAQAQTIETLTARVKEIETQKENLLFAIDELKAARTLAEKAEDSLDSFMNNVSATLTNDKISKLQRQLEDLNKQQEESRQLIALARPALERVPAKPAAAPVPAPAPVPPAIAKPFAVPAAPTSHAPATPTPAPTPSSAAPPSSSVATPLASSTTASNAKARSTANYVSLFETTPGEADRKGKRGPELVEGDVHNLDPEALEKSGGDPAAGGLTAKKAKKDAIEEAEAFQEWVPPTNQSGDGRTHLNDLYGY